MRLGRVGIPFLGLFIGTAVFIIRNWKSAEHPICTELFDADELQALAGAPVGSPEVDSEQVRCIADWGSVQLKLHRFTMADQKPYDLRADAWRAEPGFVSLHRLDELRGFAAVVEQVRFGGHVRWVKLVAERPAGWLEVAVIHHWAEPQTPKLAADEVETRLVATVARHLAATNGFFVAEER